ncbi:hypothetical protein [Microbacterium maritypicum]|uniref:Uncharacterized protein n=2 Tax=Microbacterium maritypicum TaxID=33918 RepID=A0ACD4B8S8_MICMQ|nr:hypothetical protein [Microbacterium liquefaciens]UTT53791.1 hypothetical protein NMQ05_04210 [Microbacterium liquefaciens]UTT53857.1 hypothetical protein NMQ05_04545 [Microbacterium liquefaciens]
MSDEYTITTRSEGLLGKVGQWGAALITDEELLEALDAHDAEVRAGAVAEEPEWGIANAKTPDKVWALSEEGARETAAAEPGQWIIYSRPKTVVHEWVPVKQEGASPSGLPVAGLLHAGGDSYTEREDADQPETDAEPVPEGLIHPPGDDEHEQEQGADEQVPVELHTDDSTPDGRHTSMKQEGAET